MTIETIYTCPLGHTCEEIKNNKIHRCMWYTQIAGMNPQTGEPIDEWKCAITWLPLLSVEMSMTNRGQTAAIESFRNETVSGQQQFTNLLARLADQRKRLSGE
jgi:hypothetical protein